MKIAVDAYGADKGPEEIYHGCAMALDRHPELTIGIVGPESLKTLPSHERLHVVATDEWIQNEEEPAKAVRQKKQASIVLGARLMEEEGYEGVLSAGSTGAMLATGLLISKRIPGIQRAALTVLLPTMGHPTVMLDAGANMDCSKELLLQFAVMGDDEIDLAPVLVAVVVEDRVFAQMPPGFEDFRYHEGFKNGSRHGSGSQGLWRRPFRQVST